MTAKILVADDSITIQKIVALAFENEDAIVEGIGNGDDALTRLKSFQPDVVLADIDMPGLNGFELSREIKESSEFNSIRILLLTNDFEEFDENLFQASLADNHITKPFKSEDLVKKVKTLLEDDSPVDKAMAIPNDDSSDEPSIKENDEAEDEETEFVIELSQADRVDDDVIVDLGEDLQMNSPDELVIEDDEVVLDLPSGLEPTSVENDEPEVFPENIDAEIEELATPPVAIDSEPKEDLPLEVAASQDNPIEADDPAENAENNETGQEEGLDELLLQVEELSRQSAEISENRISDELSPLEAIDEMLKEVSALKEEAFHGSSADENDLKETIEPPFSSNTAVNGLGFGEVEYVSEENADLLATAFDEITNGTSVSLSTTDSPPENPESFFQEDAEESGAGTELENLTEEFSEHFLSTPDTEPVFEESAIPVSNEELSAPINDTMAADNGDCDAHIEKPGEPALPGDSQLSQLMEKEVRNILQQSLAPLIEKEISGLSEKILHAVEENVRQVTPGIAKMVIEKEIDKIKTMENG
jgi:CheY-like chemotaxis protein